MTNTTLAKTLALRGSISYTPRAARSVSTETTHVRVRTSLSNDIYAKRA